MRGIVEKVRDALQRLFLKSAEDANKQTFPWIKTHGYIQRPLCDQSQHAVRNLGHTRACSE